MDNHTEIKDANYVTDTGVYFYTPRYYAFDNLSAYSINLWGHTFMTTEHAYQWKKFSVSHPEIAQEILNASSAYLTKKISDANQKIVDPKWYEIRVAVMEEILKAKIAQHEKISRLLLETTGKEIYENSPTDYFWGIGADGTGENQLGKLWMKLRAEISEK